VREQIRGTFVTISLPRLHNTVCSHYGLKWCCRSCGSWNNHVHVHFLRTMQPICCRRNTFRRNIFWKSIRREHSESFKNLSENDKLSILFRFSCIPFCQFAKTSSQRVVERWKSVEFRSLVKHSFTCSKLLHCGHWHRCVRSHHSPNCGSNSEWHHSACCK